MDRATIINKISERRICIRGLEPSVNNGVVATEDKELIKKLKKSKIPVIIIRQKKYLRLISP